MKIKTRHISAIYKESINRKDMTYMNRYRLIYTLLLTALMASTNVSAGVTVKGNVYGGGNLADVKTNTTVNMGGGTVAGNTEIFCQRRTSAL